MRKYFFASSVHKNNVNLCEYKSLITKVIQEIHPGAKVKVVADGYYLSDDVGRGDVIKIGRELAKSKLGKYSINRPVLFKGLDMEAQNGNNKNNKKKSKRKEGA